MSEEFEISQGKTLNDLGHEALWFVAHTFIAVASMLITIFVISLFHPDPNASGPKIVGTILAFFIPLAVGLIIARSQHNEIGRYVWISGLLIFAIVCVWVLDLPTGNGLCENCGAMDKLWRTFFSFDNGSGLMGGQGVLLGFWIPLSLFGYAIGSRIGLDS